MSAKDHCEDIFWAEWMAHTPHLLVNQDLHVGQAMLIAIPEEKIVINLK